VLWNGVLAAPAIVDTGQLGNYTHYTFDVVGSAGQSTLEFDARDDNGYWNLDDVSVRQTASTTIASGAAVHIDASDIPGDVHFAGGTGALVIDNAQDFGGSIYGFTGTAPDAAHSDLIDLTNINYNASFHESYDSGTGQLTLTDGTTSAELTFVGFTGSFVFESDNNGGTIILDPPASASPAAAAGTPAPVAAANGHGFVFNFGNAGHETWTNSHPANDAQHPTPANTPAAWSAAHEAGTGNPAAPDAHDAMTSAAIIKAQLHAHDFHFV
jgi:hypothetical protein